MKDKAKYFANVDKYRQEAKDYYRRVGVNKRLLKQHGITRGQYDEMLRAQGGVCAICKRVPRRQRNAALTFGVDHDHGTGEIRGLLCN